MTGEDHLPGRSEDPDLRHAVRAGRRTDEGRLREVQFPGDLLHGRVVKAGGVGKDGQRIPFQRPFGKDIYHSIAILTRACHLRFTLLSPFNILEIEAARAQRAATTAISTLYCGPANRLSTQARAGGL